MIKKPAKRLGISRELPQARIGVIGGSGLYDMENLQEVREVSVATPFGRPSGKFIMGSLKGVPVAFLPRHGRGHTILPSEINYRANIFAMKKLGVERILSVSAVGSMKEEIAPGDVVLPGQFYDLTKGRRSTFFGNGIVAHVSLADPVCPELTEVVAMAGQDVGATLHRGGTYLCMEGPQFSTRAESDIHRKWGVSVIGMTNVTEAKLAREAEICYVSMAMATDYDCWHIGTGPVTAEMVLKTLKQNVALSKNMIQAAVGRVDLKRNCLCADALKNAIVTDPSSISRKLKSSLRPIIGKYLS
ncbi:MAG: S-methyl-5'-thioadenosine phosphorylase [Nitrospira sp.]|nr:S-methyl-5'-thioadenosine phosphorylase [Candidatus Manganitrophaceae bacterium]HIL34930.1 S-methyl-5'-thioadenosine phosphorylase [Candidatus Manganitrophaceae bacterium]